MADQSLERWARQLTQDPVKGNNQRRKIEDEEWLQGWGRLQGITAQQLNQLMFLLTSYASPVANSPYQQLATVPVNSETLIFNGTTVVSVDTAPEVFSLYGSTLPDYTAQALPNHVWVIRKQ